MRQVRAAVLHEYDPQLSRKDLVSYEEVEEPSAPGHGEVIIEVRAAGVCRTDLHIISGQPIGVATASLPHILGHENAGIVRSVGEAVAELTPGDKVVCYPFLSSGLSLEERYGIDSQAEHRTTPGINAPGGFCELVKFTERSLIKVPAQVSLDSLAPLGDAGVTAYGAYRKLASFVRPQDVVVAIGMGGVGHIGVQLLKRLTPAQVLAVDNRPEARKLAAELGKVECYDPAESLDKVMEMTKGRGARAVVDFVGLSETASMGIRMLANRGRYVAVGTGGEVSVPTAELVGREISVVGSFVGTYTDLLEVTNLTVRREVTSHVVPYPLSAANEALHDLAAGRVLGRAVLIPD